MLNTNDERHKEIARVSDTMPGRPIWSDFGQTLI